MWDVFKKRDGEAVAAGSLELKVRGISYSGWEVRTDGVGMFVAEKRVDSVVKVERHSESVDTEDGPGQWLVEYTYSIHSSLRKDGGGKAEFLERTVPLGELYTSE